MALIAPVSITRRRPAAGSYVDGRWVAAGTTDVPLLASVQPMRGRDLERLDEGQRARDGRRLYLEGRDQLRTADQHAGTNADQVLIDGAWFEVVHVDDSHHLIAHTRAYALRLQESA